jgi:hypothetical protein
MSLTEMKDSQTSAKRIKGVIDIDNKKMINYVNEEQLIRCVGADHYKHLKDTLSKKLGHKASLRETKHEIVTNAYYDKLISQIRNSPIGSQACDKYLQARKRAQNMDKKKCHVVKKAMTQARNRFLGCLATRISSQIFDEVLDCFDDPKYDNIKIIPNTLKHRVYENTTDEQLKEYLEPSVKELNLSNNIPPGMKGYMRKHPQEFIQQNRELQSQRKLANTILRSMKSEQLSRLQAHIEQNKHFDPKKFSEIIGR